MAAGGGGGGIADEKAPEAFGLSRHVAEAEMEEEDGGAGGGESSVKSKLSGLLWHGGSAYDAWFSCASNQVVAVVAAAP